LGRGNSKFAGGARAAPIRVGEPFAVTARLRNDSPHVVSAQLLARQTSATGRSVLSDFLVLGPSKIELDPLAPGREAVATLRLLPLAAGLHELRGIVAVDAATGVEYAPLQAEGVVASAGARSGAAAAGHALASGAGAGGRGRRPAALSVVVRQRARED
jgi:hypothetical protein